MPEFIVVRCCSCDTWQVTQRRKPQGKLQVSKWQCKICSKSQSVTNVASSSTQAAELRPLVQELNMNSGKKRMLEEEAPAEPAEVLVPVWTPYSADWAALASSSSSSSEEGEALPLFNDRAASSKRRRKQGGASATQPAAAASATKAAIERDDEGFARPLARASRPAPPPLAEEEEGEDGFMLARDSSRFVAVDDEVWQEPATDD